MTHVNRPADGFHVRYTAKATEAKRAICARSERLCRRIEAIVERIKLIGHIDGHSLDENEPFLNRIMSDFDKDHDSTASVLYDLMGDSATIRGISTWPDDM